MNYKEIDLDEFIVVGISVRTSNAKGQAMLDIGNLWSRFYSEQIIAAIPNKISDDIFCIYTDYESDYTGEYTTFLGCKVSSAETLPQDLTKKVIATSSYRRYESKGKIPECVGETWTNIWKENKNIPRAYSSDFNVYEGDMTDMENALVRTFLAIK